MALIDKVTAYYKLDEASGADATDSHAGFTGVRNGTITAGTGKLNGCRVFSPGSYFVASNAAFNFGDTDFTFAAWVKLTTKSFGSILAGGDARIWYSSGSDRFKFGADWNAAEVLADNFGSPSTGVFYFVVAWHDAIANTNNIQVNDGTVNSAAYSGGGATNTTFSIGGTDGFDGSLDEVGIYSGVLTSGERTSLYNAGAAFAYPFSGGAAFIARPNLRQRQAVNRASRW